MKITLPKIVTAITVIVSIIVMFGWFLDISVLKSVIPGGVQMKFITALMFLASAIIVYYASTPPTNINRVVALGFSSAFVFFILLLLSLVYFGFDTGIGELFVREAKDVVKTVTPGYPSIGTMVAFFLVAFAGPMSLYLDRHKTMIQTLAGSISAIGSIALIGSVPR